MIKYLLIGLIVAELCRSALLRWRRPCSSAFYLFVFVAWPLAISLALILAIFRRRHD